MVTMRGDARSAVPSLVVPSFALAGTFGIVGIAGALAGFAMGWRAVGIRRWSQSKKTKADDGASRQGASPDIAHAGDGMAVTAVTGDAGNAFPDDDLIELKAVSDFTGLKPSTLRGSLECRMQVISTQGKPGAYYSRREALKLRRTLRRKKALAFDAMMGARDQWNV